MMSYPGILGLILAVVETTNTILGIGVIVVFDESESANFVNQHRNTSKTA